MRYAFVMGSNGPTNDDLEPLRYAHQDAERMKVCLSSARCGFAVNMPEPGMDTFEVRRQLTRVAEACDPKDDFVCYFSGHGTLEKGNLILLWDNTISDRLLSTALPVSDILQVLKYCKARSRLLILDCCHAGAVATTLGLKNGAGIPIEEIEISPDNYYILMASDRLEPAREFETLQGSFLTTNIIAALEDKFTKADKDEDGRISMHDLHQWLEYQTKIHNQLQNTKVSYPYLIGKQKGEFYLTLTSSTWVPYEFKLPDGSTMIVLPINPYKSSDREYRVPVGFFSSEDVLCIGKYPITNSQYKRFVAEGRGNMPTGEHFIHQSQKIMQNYTPEEKKLSSWQGPFYPWRTKGFRESEKPVVCVSYRDAIAYCEWANNLKSRYNRLVFLPSPELWDFAAFGTTFPSYDPDSIFTRFQRIHHKAAIPADIDHTGARSNTLGVSDLLGNVWEWCGESEDNYEYIYSTRPGLALLLSRPRGETRDLSFSVELRGGGFLDDLSLVKPTLTAHRLKDGVNLRHSDLGFRVAAVINMQELPEETQQRLLSI